MRRSVSACVRTRMYVRACERRPIYVRVYGRMCEHVCVCECARDFGYSTNFVEGNKLKGYIFKFVWLQGICKSKMAAVKSFINKIDMNLAGQCCLIRDQEDGGIEVNMASLFPRNT